MAQEPGQGIQMNYGQPEAPQILGGEFNPNKSLVYAIHGRPAFSYADVKVTPNQRVLVDGTSMLWMDSHLQMDTECYGGCCASFWRRCSGESCCMNMYSGDGNVTVGFSDPGDMLAFGVTQGHGWLLTRCAFVAGTDNLKVSADFSGCAACCCSDEGTFLTKIEIDEESQTTQGVFLAGSYGMLEKHDVPEGKKLMVGKGNFFATDATKTLSIGMVGGLGNFCCGAGWNSIVLQFEGPCTVYTQSRNPQDLERLRQIARMKNRGGDSAGDDQGGDGGGVGAEMMG